MSLTTISTIRLDINTTITHFDCGDSDLNDFLTNDAANYQKERLAVTHLALLQMGETTEIAGYFCLLTDKLVFDPVDEEQRKQWKLFNKKNRIHFNKHRKTYPAVKIGRLAVSSAFAGKGIGSFLIDHIVALIFAMDNIGCRFITVDAYKNAFDFYLKNDFKFLTDDDEQEQTRQMYFDMKQFIFNYEL
jgi:GNAT superfamily N-acetyltransferase